MCCCRVVTLKSEVALRAVCGARKVVNAMADRAGGEGIGTDGDQSARMNRVKRPRMARRASLTYANRDMVHRETAVQLD